MGDDSREQSPDWLRSFQPPTLSTIELSSGSDTPLDYSPVSDDEDGINLSKLFKKEETQASSINDNDDGKVSVVEKSVEDKSSRKSDKVKRTPEKKRKNVDDSMREGKRGKGKEANRRNKPEKHDKSNNHSFWSLSSDSESSGDAPTHKKDKAIKREISPNKDLATENEKEIDNLLLNHDGESPKNQASKANSPMKKQEKEDGKTSKKNITSRINGEDDTKNNIVKEDNSGKHAGPQASSSKLPLLLSDKVQRSKALVECEGDFIDLSGDVGSVGRVVISDDPSKNHEMFLDLKGTIYKTTIVPSRTFCVVSFGQSEAKIEAIMNDYIQLKPQSNVYEAETMVEGTLEGFSFGSEDEADKPVARADHGEGGEEQLDGKTKRKPDKTSGPARKKGKPTGGGKPAKKVKKKPQVSKKGKAKK
ncbi:hypothetical protein ABFS82_06G012400 [Erythranthe guttata]